MKEFRLPDGSYTDNADLFSAEWDRLLNPLETLGFRVIGFDPDIALCDEKTGDGSFRMPVYAAERFLDKLAAQQRLLDTLQEDFTALQHAIVGDTARSAILEVEKLKEFARLYSFLRENPEWLGLEHDFRPDEIDRMIRKAIKEEGE